MIRADSARLPDWGGVHMQKELIVAIGGGLASALLCFGVFTGAGSGMLFAYLAPLPIFLAGLSSGFRSVTIGVLTGMVLIAAISGLVPVIKYAALIAAPTWLACRYILMTQTGKNAVTIWYPIGDALSRLCAYGGLLLILAALWVSGEGGLVGVIQENMDKAFTAQNIFKPAAERRELIELVSPYIPATIFMTWLLMITINLTLAQTILVKSGKNLRPTPTYSALYAPEWLYWAFVGAGVLVLIGAGSSETIEYVGRNLALIFAAPFFFIGLGTVHVLVRQTKRPGTMLAAFYVFIITVDWASAVVAGIGFFEQWVELRTRYSAPPPDENKDEEEE